MNKIINNIEKILDGCEKKTEAELFLIGELIMYILLTETNLDTLRNPIKRYKKLLSKLTMKKNTNQVLKYCKQTGLKAK